MNIPSLGLFHWQETYAHQAKYVLAYSNIPGISYEKYQTLTGCSVPAHFNLNKNDDRGASELRELLCSQYSCRDGNVVTSTGGSEANFLVFLALLSSGDEVIVESPIYEPLYRIPEFLGARPILWERCFDNRYQLELESLKELITEKTRLVVLTNLHNPSGVFIPKNVFQRLGELAEHYEFYVLIDEIFLEGMIPHHSSVFGMPRMIITSSMTKIYGVGGLRTGWIIAPQEIAEKCQLVKSYTTGCSSYLSETMSSNLLRNGTEQLLQEYISLSHFNRKIMKQWIHRYRDLLEWVEPDGGVVCFPKYRGAISSEELCLELLRSYDVLVTPGCFFNKDGYIRISFGVDTKVLEPALTALGDGLETILSPGLK